MIGNGWEQLSKDRNMTVREEITPKRKAGHPGKPKLEVPEQTEWQMPKPERRKSFNGVFEIATNIPIDDGLAKHDKRGYPYRELEIGESFWVPLNGKDRKKFRIQNHIPGRRFTGRTRVENGEMGARVWRIK